MSRLELRWRKRAGEGGATERTYLDFVIDGRSLLDMSGRLDLIGGMGWGLAEGERSYIDRLLLRSPPDSPSGRISIYVCPECGDIGCGALTARIEQTADSFVWSELGYENDYDPSMADLDSYKAIGPFVFAKSEYLGLLEGRRSELHDE